MSPMTSTETAEESRTPFLRGHEQEPPSRSLEEKTEELEEHGGDQEEVIGGMEGVPERAEIHLAHGEKGGHGADQNPDEKIQVAADEGGHRFYAFVLLGWGKRVRIFRITSCVSMASMQFGEMSHFLR